MVPLRTLSQRYLSAWQELDQAAEALAQLLVDLLQPAIPDIKGSPHWWGSDSIHLFSDAIARRTQQNIVEVIEKRPEAYCRLSRLILEVAEEAGVEMPLVETPYIYLTEEEQARVREILRRAFGQA